MVSLWYLYGIYIGGTTEVKRTCKVRFYEHETHERNGSFIVYSVFSAFSRQFSPRFFANIIFFVYFCTRVGMYHPSSAQ